VVSSSRFRASLVLTVVLAGVAYVVAALCLIVLTWDGAGYVFNSIERGRPAIPNGRYSDYPFLCVVYLLSRVISDPLWLAGIYGLVLALLPLGSLLLSFDFLSGSQLRPLRIWPVLGILLSVLPGQAFFVAEAVPLVQVSWALWAIVAAEISHWSLVWLAVLSAFLFFLHPTAALTYGATGGLFLAKAAWATRQRGLATWLGLAFLVLTILRLWYALATANSYERGEESLTQNYQAFCSALPSIGILPFVYLLGLTVLGAVTGQIPNRLTNWLSGLLLGLLVVYGLVWAADPRLWVGAFSFRRFELVGTLPLLVLGVLHWRYGNRVGDNKRRSASSPTDSASASYGATSWIMLGSAAAFLLVFTTQAFSWREELSRFQADLRRCDKPVATIDDLPWVPGTPLNHWASTPLSCVIQGRKVKTLFALHAADVSERKVLLFPGTWFRTRNRWFELELSEKEQGIDSR